MKKSNFELKLLAWLMLIFIVAWIFLFSLGIMTWEIVIILGIPIIIIGSLLILGIVTIPNDPPSFGMITRLDKREWKGEGKIVFLNEGLNWIILRKILFKVKVFDLTQRQPIFKPQGVITPDNVDEEIPISSGYIPDKYDFITYLNLGKDTGVLDSMKEIIESSVRRWSRHPIEGPQSWEEIIKSSLKAINFLVKFLGKYLPENNKDIVPGYDYLKKIHSAIPTEILMDWYEGKDPSNLIVRKEYGDGKDDPEIKYELKDKWRKLEEKLKESLTDGHTEEQLKSEIKERIQLLKKLLDGNANLPTISLGIVLKRLSITEIKPFGEVYQASIALQKEQKQRISETYEFSTNMIKANMLKESLEKSGVINISLSDCFAAIMKWQMIKEGRGYVYDGPFGNFAGLGDLISSIMKGGGK